MQKQVFRKGQHVICKYKLEKEGAANGDLIVGLIESVRTTGDVTGVNLLTGSKFRKNAKLLATRNVICPKRVAVAILREAAGDRVVARREAVAYAGMLQGAVEEKKVVPVSNQKKIDRIVSLFAKLTPEEKQEALKKLLE